MARFILDIANLDADKVKEVCELVSETLNTELTSGVITVNCIDTTNDNQFHNEDDIENGKSN